jgi:hypothetical protein
MHRRDSPKLRPKGHSDSVYFPWDVWILCSMANQMSTSSITDILICLFLTLTTFRLTHTPQVLGPDLLEDLLSKEQKRTSQSCIVKIAGCRHYPQMEEVRGVSETLRPS